MDVIIIPEENIHKDNINIENNIINNIDIENSQNFYKIFGKKFIMCIPPENMIDLLNNSNRPIITFSAQYPEKHFQKLSVLKYFNLSLNTDFLDSYQIEGGVFICKKTDLVVNFVKKWLDLVLYDNYKLVIDSIDNEEELMDFLEHRHDQSILSILCKKFGTNIICCNEAYGSGPFFSSRLTDGLPRRFAPDLFRTDIRYDEDRHFTWNEWLNDYPEARYNYDFLLKHINQIV
jgi:hypothetical protein